MKRKQKRILIRIIITACILIGLFFIKRMDIPNMYLLFMYFVPYFLIGYDILWKAVRNIGHGQIFDENFLMVVATIGAIALGEYSEGVAVMFFYQIGEFFQAYALGKSRKNISELMDIRPDYANIEKDGELVQVDPTTVSVGRIIVVKPGEKVPLDGIIVEGSTSLNTSALTGESLPKDLSEGEGVVSGCINMTGLIKIKTTKEFGESTATKILELVENSGYNKAKSEAFITRFAKIYTPIVCAGALLLGLFPPLIRMVAMGLDPAWGDWVLRALTFLVISCPCALVVSIPLSFFAGIGGASNSGILVKGSNYLENLSKASAIYLDKTGTVSMGVFEVVAIHHSPFDDQKLLEYAALAESYSPHPLSQCFKKAYKGELDKKRVKSVKEYSGHGVVATVDDKEIAAGNDKLMKQLNIQYPNCQFEDIGTIVHVAIDGEYSGHIVVRDMIKPTAAEAIQKLKATGIKDITMLTGDKKEIADLVGKELNIPNIKSELLPEDKVKIVAQAMEKEKPKEKMIFVGDGINDAPVLVKADLGIAMGALGAEAAIEAADIVLMDDNPVKIPKAIRISKKCMRLVHENIALAIGVKVLCLALSAVGIANMWMAIFADVGILIIAVFNAMRALYVKNL